MAILGSGPSKEAVEILDLAYNAFDSIEDNREGLDNVASLCALAIKKAGVPYPAAESLLAGCLIAQEKNKEAITHARLALQSNPYEFRAQSVIVFDALTKVKVIKLGVRDFLGGTGSGDLATKLVTGAITTVFAGIFSLGKAGHSALTQNDFKRELLNLVEIYRKLCQNRIDGSDYLSFSDTLLRYGDVIKDMPMPGEKPNLYDEIVRIPLSKIDIGDYEKKITDIRYLAEGRSMLLKK